MQMVPSPLLSLASLCALWERSHLRRKLQKWLNRYIDVAAITCACRIESTVLCSDSLATAGGCWWKRVSEPSNFLGAYVQVSLEEKNYWPLHYGVNFLPPTFRQDGEEKSEEIICNAFKVFDEQGTGMISERTVRHVFFKLLLFKMFVFSPHNQIPISCIS